MGATTCINLRNIMLSEKYISYLHEISRIGKPIPIERLVVVVVREWGGEKYFETILDRGGSSTTLIM